MANESCGGRLSQALFAGGNLPLHYAVIASKIDILGFLLGKGAWVEGSNEKDDTILHIAAR